VLYRGWPVDFFGHPKCNRVARATPIDLRLQELSDTPMWCGWGGQAAGAGEAELTHRARSRHPGKPEARLMEATWRRARPSVPILRFESGPPRPEPAMVTFGSNRPRSTVRLIGSYDDQRPRDKLN